ncbi:hypothetical protein B0H14DRAFT_2604857 [Mycena olivaceomarginata]|nr:hypothetical protein B0H14DRAFT_2604857 [Mycena olivaceomarginata]
MPIPSPDTLILPRDEVHSTTPSPNSNPPVTSASQSPGTPPRGECASTGVPSAARPTLSFCLLSERINLNIHQAVLSASSTPLLDRDCYSLLSGTPRFNGNQKKIDKIPSKQLLLTTARGYWDDLKWDVLHIAQAKRRARMRDTKQLKEEIEETRAPFWGACGWSNPLKGTTVIVIARMCPAQHQGVHRDSTMEATAAMGAEARESRPGREN